MNLIKNKIYSIILICLFIVSLSFPPLVNAANEQAIFAGGCFWCLEHDFEELPGVESVKSGYSGGSSINPTYTNHSGHQEAIIVDYNSKKVTYSTLLRSYWRNIDPFDRKGQFCDKGDSYRPVIFTKNEKQYNQAIDSLEKATGELGVKESEVYVEITPFKIFWEAEKYHQDYAKNNQLKYNFYRYSCGRNNRLEKIWGINSQTNNAWQ